MTSLSETTASIVQSFGYVGLFGLLVVGSMGAPISSEILLPLVGVAAKAGNMDLYLAFGVAVAAQLIGFCLAYYIARREGAGLVTKYGKYLFIHRRQIADFRKLMRKHGNIILLVGLCTPGIHGYLGYPAGLEGMKFRHYFLLLLAGVLAWTAALVGLGYVAGGHLAIFEKIFSGTGIIVTLVLVAGGIIWYSRRRSIHRSKIQT